MESDCLSVNKVDYGENTVIIFSILIFRNFPWEFQVHGWMHILLCAVFNVFYCIDLKFRMLIHLTIN